MIVVTAFGRVLMDREALHVLSGRSVNTIRARCEVLTHAEGRALYDSLDCLARLREIPTRRRAS